MTFLGCILNVFSAVGGVRGVSRWYTWAQVPNECAHKTWFIYLFNNICKCHNIVNMSLASRGRYLPCRTVQGQRVPVASAPSPRRDRNATDAAVMQILDRFAAKFHSLKQVSDVTSSDIKTNCTHCQLNTNASWGRWINPQNLVPGQKKYTRLSSGASI